MTRIRLSTLAFSALASITFSVNSFAVEEGEKFLIEIGSLSTNTDTVISVDGAGGNLGTSVDLENDLGYETGKQINRVNFRYRFTDKHSVKYAFFQLNRSTSRMINRNIIVGDTTYQVNANLSSRFDYSLHSISYGYSLFSNDDSKLDLLGGLYYIKTGFSISEASLGSTESTDAAAPLPLIGLNYEKELNDEWNLSAAVTIFKLSYDDYDGTVIDNRVRIDYQFTERFGLGLAYNWEKLNVGVSNSTGKADFDMTSNGLELSAVLRF
ncbi:MAG: hypothetical protein ACI9H8_001569 [Lysobacterales bacterium]|jgi:hypothetical protein